MQRQDQLAAAQTFVDPADSFGGNFAPWFYPLHTKDKDETYSVHEFFFPEEFENSLICIMSIRDLSSAFTVAALLKAIP
jgi:hypothetical protein